MRRHHQSAETLENVWKMLQDKSMGKINVFFIVYCILSFVIKLKIMRVLRNLGRCLFLALRMEDSSTWSFLLESPQKVKVKSAYEPWGPSGRSLSRFL